MKKLKKERKAGIQGRSTANRENNTCNRPYLNQSTRVKVTIKVIVAGMQTAGVEA